MKHGHLRKERIAMPRRYETLRAIGEQLDDLCQNFDKYIQVFNDDPPFTKSQWEWHQKTIRKRKELNGVTRSIESDEFLSHLLVTLNEWGMNKRGSKLVPYGEFISKFRLHKDFITSFDQNQISELDWRTSENLWELIHELKISESGSQLVAGTKAIHHLLPELLPPMDRGYTKPFFRYHNSQFQGKNQESAFKFIIPYFAQISRRVDLSSHMGKTPWATSRSKVIDNAIIGYCKHHPLLVDKFNPGTLGQHEMDVSKILLHIRGCRVCHSVADS